MDILSYPQYTVSVQQKNVLYYPEIHEIIVSIKSSGMAVTERGIFCKTHLAEISLSKTKKHGLLYHCLGVMNLQIRVRNLREDKDMTQKQMADMLCCSQRVYSNYERGEVDIPSRVWMELAKFHGTSVDYLMELTDQKEPYPERKKRLYTL